MTTIYQRSRAERLREAQAILARMKERHPNAFPRPPRPLRVGIREEFIAAGWTEAEVSTALSYYLSTESYLKATIAAGAFRIDLRGLPVAPVQPHEAQWARSRLHGPFSYSDVHWRK